MTHKVTFKYPHGIDAECMVTGYKGKITSRLQLLSGSIQYGLQPKLKTGAETLATGYSIDEQNIRPIADKANKKQKFKSEIVDFFFRPGDKVKSRITGFKGIVCSACEFLNKCQSYSIEGCDILDKDHKPIRHDLAMIEIEKIDAGLHIDMNTKQSQDRRTGGPNMALSYGQSK